MHGENEKPNIGPVTQWANNVKLWATIVMILGGALVGAVKNLSDMKQQIALLNQRLEIITGDHEKRITNLEISDRQHASQIDRLNAMHDTKLNSK